MWLDTCLHGESGCIEGCWWQASVQWWSTCRHLEPCSRLSLGSCKTNTSFCTSGVLTGDSLAALRAYSYCYGYSLISMSSYNEVQQYPLATVLAVSTCISTNSDTALVMSALALQASVHPFLGASENIYHTGRSSSFVHVASVAAIFGCHCSSYHGYSLCVHTIDPLHARHTLRLCHSHHVGGQ